VKAMEVEKAVKVSTVIKLVKEVKGC
jgi:hypothetical protein